MPDQSGESLVLFRNRSAAGGVNTFAFATDIADDEAAELTNIDASVPGQRRSRQGLTLAATGITFGPILALAGFQPVNQESLLLAVSPGATYPNAADLRLWKWDGTSVSWTLVGQLTGFTCATMGVQIVVGTDLQSVVGKPYIARIFGENTFQISYAYDGTTLGFSTNAAAAPIAKLFPAAYQGNRGFAGGAATYRGLMFFTDTGIFATTGWDITKSVTLGGGQRQLVKAIAPFRNTDLIIFMADRIDVVSINDAISSPASPVTGFTNWSRDVIDTKIGGAGYLAWTSTGQDLLFADQYGNVRSLNRTITDNQQGVRSDPVSTPIKAYIDRINPTVINKINAEFFDHFAFFGFPLDSATEVSHTFALDVVTGKWYGPWIGKFPGKVMAVAVLSSASAASKLQDPSLYIGSADTNGGKVYHAFDGTTDAGDPIVYQETTKRFTFGEIETSKFFRRLYEIWEASGSESVLVEARKDGREWVSLGSAFSVLGDAPTIPVTFPINFGGVGIVRQRFTLEDFGEIPYDIQLRMTCTCTSQIKHLGFTLAIHKKNIDWTVD